MNTFTNFEMSKLLKEKGYDAPCYGRYIKSKTKVHVSVYYMNHNIFSDTSAPTIAEVVMWVYEKHGIWISTQITIHLEFYYKCYNMKDKLNINNYPEVTSKPGNYFNSPTEAYLAAIEYTLTNLI